MTSPRGETGGLVVVGGGPAAYATVSAYREAGGADAVTVVSDDDTAPYNRPPLSKDYLRAEVEDEAQPLADDDFWSDVDLRLRTRATGLDPLGRTVALADGSVLPYTCCVLATGAYPTPLPVPGGTDPGVLMLRSLAQARQLREAAGSATSAVVVGSGFIGCEAAVSLAIRGLSVTVVTQEERPQQLRLGAEAGRRIETWLHDAGVRLRTGAEVSAVGARQVEVAGGETVAADLVLVAGGVTPHVELAHTAGLAVRRGRIPVDARMRTGMPGLWAAGDVALARNAAAERELVVEHWGEALAMGEIAGTGAAGGDAAWAEVPGFWSDIGGRTLKHAAWGDGFDDARLVDYGEAAFTIWYGRAGSTVGVLTHEADDDYERGRELIEAGAPLP
ncbi:MAG: FAD-dependent oxidoreductase [Nocardioidaceae bacterium]|nr:FAD-dependent oxidoreductase [Nocardioidaceae bacterium]